MNITCKDSWNSLGCSKIIRSVALRSTLELAIWNSAWYRRSVTSTSLPLVQSSISRHKAFKAMPRSIISCIVTSFLNLLRRNLPTALHSRSYLPANRVLFYAGRRCYRSQFLRWSIQTQQELPNAPVGPYYLIDHCEAVNTRRTNCIYQSSINKLQ